MFPVKYRWFLPVVGVIGNMFFCSLTYAYEVLIPAAQIQQGQGSVTLYHTRRDGKLNLQVKNREEIKVGDNRYFSEVANNLETDGKGESLAAKLVMNPWNGFYYWFKAGSGSYELGIPSETVKNKLSGQEKGWILGLGLSSLLFPDTIVTPALAVGIGVNYSVYDLDTFQSGTNFPERISNKVELSEWQGEVIISKKFSRFEPFGGLKVSRTYTLLREKADFGKVEGVKDSAGVFLGTKIKIYSHESIVVEGSFIDGTILSVGWNVGF